ncbi:uncharacterized protein LOC8280198 [Ricinus communis]|uniref:DUF506 domain-containing protein n=1 Tax=Ricinus communis TaxID=3988 RepID=B9RTH3_RICCO|nr:uncharacterized protein LOC8280198 [Ricinus communis]EEF45205.1 conserved hypothetical protein [Ricinus communis]|eukprot:XP_002517042.1 uncharacterized protein LOC8280198 [Ricinus communis]
MPFPMKIQPIDIDCQNSAVPARAEPVKPVLKSRLKRLFDRQFRVSSVEKQSVSEGNKDGGSEFEPSSVCLAKMVQNYIEESNEKPPPLFRGGRHRCNCFNGNNNDSSDDEFDVFGGSGGGFGESISNGSFGDASDILKSLIPCASVSERNLLADTAMIVEKNKNCKQKDDLRKIITDGLSSLGYNSSICKSKWDKSPSHPAGEYEYIDVIIEGERVLIDMDFRSEFEIARSTGAYKAILQSLPHIFVGKPDRLGQIVSIVSEAAKQSLKKKGMHFPPWRRAEYMRAKWLSPFTRLKNDSVSSTTSMSESEKHDDCSVASDDCGELELIFGDKMSPLDSNSSSPSLLKIPDEEDENEKVKEEFMTWQPPALKPKSIDRGAKMVTGLASLLKEKP